MGTGKPRWVWDANNSLWGNIVIFKDSLYIATYNAVTGTELWKTDILYVQVKANGQDGPITVTPSDPVSIEISLDPGYKAGQNADWWIAVKTPFAPPIDWYTYVDLTGWLPGINLYAQECLFDLSPYEVLNMTLPVGNYIFYFAINDPDGAATGPWWGMDSVVVTVQ